VYCTSVLAALGGVSVYFLVPDGPYRRKAQQLVFLSSFKSFRATAFRSAALGYFGHMWELYSFWAFLPLVLSAYNSYSGNNINVPLWSFLIIASGSLSCIAGGFLSQRFGVKKVATISLTLSCTCCLVSPLFFSFAPLAVFILFLFIWGLTVIADSPLFSTLVAQSAPESSRGSSITIVNCIGFSITIISIQTLRFLNSHIDWRYLYLLLAVGPILGLIALANNKEVHST
jgi:MFS family permease